MAYKQPRKKQYRFQGKLLSELPADVDWMQIVVTKKVPKEVRLKHSYWFVYDYPKVLNRTRNHALEKAAKASHKPKAVDRAKDLVGMKQTGTKKVYKRNKSIWALLKSGFFNVLARLNSRQGKVLSL